MNEIINSFLSFAQVSGSLLETEHGLVMLLLLYGLLTTTGQKKLLRWVPGVILTGILLSIFTPIHEIELFWPMITALVVPPYLWQAAVAVTKSGPRHRRWGVLVWGATLILVVFSLRLFSDLPFSNALLIGFLAVTLVWYFRELHAERSYLSTLGLISLAVLLVEIDIEVVSLQYWIGTLFSGVGIGFGVGFFGIYLYRRLKPKAWKNEFFLGWAYLAYLTGIAFGTSAIATTLAAALVVATYGYSIGLWQTQKSIPVPSNTPFFFYLASTVWITLGWQAHTSVDLAGIDGILAAMAVITIGILVVRKIAPVSTENRWLRLARKEIRVLLLLFGSVLFWPKQAFLTTVDVEIALVAAVLLVLLIRYSIQPIFDLMGVQLSWPAETKES